MPVVPEVLKVLMVLVPEVPMVLVPKVLMVLVPRQPSTSTAGTPSTSTAGTPSTSTAGTPSTSTSGTPGTFVLQPSPLTPEPPGPSFLQVMGGLNDAGVIGHPLILGDPTTTRSGQDADLVKAAQEGDRAAFGLLYERYGSMVHGVLLARVAWEDVDDLVQDVFITALERLASLRTPAAFGGWLAAIARNRAVDHHRRERPCDPLDVAELPAAPEEPASEAAAILAVIRTLPEAYREPLTLRLVEGMTGPEIAERTGLTPGSVRVNLHRGMRQLRDRLALSRGVR